MTAAAFALKAIVMTVALVVPGVVTARAVLSDEAPGDAAAGKRHDPRLPALLFALAWGFGMVPTFAFLFHLVTLVPVSVWTLLAASVLNTTVAAWFAVRKGHPASIRGLLALPRPAGAPGLPWPVIAAALAAAAFHMLVHDDRYVLAQSCVYKAAYVATGHIEPAVDLLRTNLEDARLGNTGVIAGFLTAFGGPGLRALHGLCGLLLALGGFVIGRGAGGRDAFGFAGLAFLSLNPYVATFPQVDENLLALAFGMGVVPFVAGARGGWAAAGATFGLMALMRHVMAPALAAMVLVAWKDAGFRRGVLPLVAGLLSVTALEHVHHAVALGSMFSFESNPQFPPTRYEVLGIEVHLRALMNWPVHDTLVRTPHNPFPMLVQWPLHLAKALGVLTLALAALGSVAIWRFSKRHASFWLLWSAVVIPGIAVQESWDRVNKLGVMAIVFGAVTAWVTAGARLVVERPRPGLPLLAAIAAAMLGGAHIVRDLRVPPDPRYSSHFALASPEIEGEVEVDARAATDIGLFPAPDFLGRHGPLISGRKVLALLADLADPAVRVTRRPWGWAPGEAPPRGAPVTVAIDFSRPPWEGFTVRPTTDPPDVDTTAPPEGTSPPAPVRVAGLAVPWSPVPLEVAVASGDEVAGVLAFLGPLPPDAPRPAPDMPSPRAEVARERALQVGLLTSTEPAAPHVIAAARAGGVLRVRIPAGALSVAVEKNLAAATLYFRRFLVGVDSVEPLPPLTLWHN